MRLYTNTRAIPVSDGESSYASTEIGRDVAAYALAGPRRYGDAYHLNSASGSEGSSTHSSVDELVRHTLRQGYTDLERRLGSAAGLSGSPFRHSRGIVVDDRTPSDASVDSAEVAQEAAFLRRLYRGLTEMRMREQLSLQHGGGGVPVEGSKKKRTVDRAALDRLTKPNASVAAKMQEKYEKRLEREQLEKKKPARVSQVATRAGQRLHLQGVSQQRELERVRKEQAEAAAAKRDDECTFQPVITSMARRLGGDGHRLVESRLEEFKQRQEERDRRRLELQAEELRKLPFRPTLSAGTQQMVAARRQSRSRSRSRSGSRRRRNHADLEVEAGERLYRDGGERLLRQQIRRRLAERQQAAAAVGGGVRLTSSRQQQVSDRLRAWQQSREEHIAGLRAEAESMRKSGQAGRARVPSTEATATAERLPLRESGAREGGAVRSSLAAAAAAATKGSEPRRTTSAHDVAGTSTSRPNAAAPVTAAPLEVAGAIDPFAAFTPYQRAIYAELRRVRFGALFYKYTAGSTRDVVTLGQVARVVQLLYPEDAGVLQALQATVSASPYSSLTKAVFIEALLEYERRCGPQPWARTEKDELLFPPPQQPVAAPSAAPAAVAVTGSSGRVSVTRSISLPSSSRGATAEPLPSYHAAAQTARRNSRRDSPAVAAPPSSGTSTRYSRSSSAPPAVVREGSVAAAASGNSPQVAGRAGHAPHMQAAVAIRGAPHVRGRSPSTCLRTQCAAAATASATRAGRAAPLSDECTFAPKLGIHTARLSDLDLERRAGYAVERELRRRELELLRSRNRLASPGAKAAVAAAAAAVSGPARASPTGSIVSGRGTPSAPHTADFSASCNVSSLSGSVGRSPLTTPSKGSGGSGPEQQRAPPVPAATAAVAPMPPANAVRTPASAAAASRAFHHLQALLDANEAPQPRPEPASLPSASSPPPQPPVPVAKPCAPASVQPAPPRGAQRAPGKSVASGAAAFTEDDVDAMFDAMYRKGRGSTWF